VTDPPGVPLASGRAADVFDLGDGTVLRRYRMPHDIDQEAKAMRWLRDAGISVPEVHSATGDDLVMELVDGPTMLADLEARPWLLLRHAATLARLQQQLNELPAPSFFSKVSPGTPGSAVLHLDLHPMNVLMSRAGPVIIDWTNVGAGDASHDAAMSYLLMSTFEVGGLRDRIGQRVLVETFARARGRDLVAAGLSTACEARLADPGTTPAERRGVERLLARSRR